MAKGQTRIASVLKKYEGDLLNDWMKQLDLEGATKDGRISEKDLRAQAAEFLSLLQQAASTADASDMSHSEWRAIEEFLEGLSKSRVLLGITSDQTATFIFSFKKPFFSRL